MKEYKEEDLEKYLKALNKAPKDSELKDYPDKDVEGQFIPIGPLQTKLDEFYKGGWSWESKIELQAYSVGVSGTITFTNPITGEVMKKSGVGAEYYKNQGVKTATPIAESSAFKNAAAKIGPAFGRDLNRVDTTEYIGSRFKGN